MGWLGDLPLVITVLGGLMGVYLVLGFVVDVSRSLNEREASRALAHLATVLFDDEVPAEAAAEHLAALPPRVLLPMAQRLAADMEGDADTRVRRLVAASGVNRRIVRRLRSKAWRRRAQAAALAPLLPEGDDRRIELLTDRHPIVRARTAAHLEAADVPRAASTLLAMLDDENTAVRFAAQQALRRGDTHIVEDLAAHLETAEGDGAIWALEVAASIPDPRLTDAVLEQARSSDPRRRAVAARAIAPGRGGAAVLGLLLYDRDDDVRVAALTAAAAVGGEILAASIGCLLSDLSWRVRLRAGQTLAELGPAGALTLRQHLLDEDAYARDMARRTLDDIAARQGRPVVPAERPAGLDTWPTERAAA